MEEKSNFATAQFFLSSLSHEIRTPLNGIIGYTQLLLQTKLDEIQKSYMNSMNQCCIHLMSLINDILDFSKLSGGKINRNRDCFTFHEIINETNASLSYRIKEKKQRCKYIIHKELPEYIVSDKNKLIQILINLVSNANKFTPVGGRIIIEIVPNTNADNQIQISVEDNGIGISQEEQKKIFDPFYQVESTTKIGSGLGLAISKKLVELLDGTISVDSEINHGSIFRFTFKYETIELFQKQLESKSTILKNRYGLIVDSNVDSRLSTGELLFELKMRAVVCSSSKEAISMIEKNRYPFVVCLIDENIDLGISILAAKIKEISPELSIIEINSNTENNSNIDFSITKPINKIKLLDCLLKCLQDELIDDCIIGSPRSESKNKEEIRCETKPNYPNILVVEDISYNLNILIKMLESMGYKNIDTASDGEEAIKKIENNRYDVVLLDLKMPKIGGFEVAEFIRKKYKSEIKIAILTASVLESDRERCKSLNIKYFILKPINMTHLKIVLKQLTFGSN